MSSMQPGGVRKQVGYLDAALAVLPEACACCRAAGRRREINWYCRIAELFRPRLAIELVEQRLGIEGFQMARTAGHEQEDHGLGLWPRPMRRLRCQRIGGGADASCMQQRRQGQACRSRRRHLRRKAQAIREMRMVSLDQRVNRRRGRR